MATILNYGLRARSKGTGVRRVQPNPIGGRPTDPLVLGFEGSFEGLIATENDADAIVRGLEMLVQYDSIAQIELNKLCQTHALDSDRALIRELRKIKIRLITHLAERANRLKSTVIPELQSITTSLDRELEDRERFQA